MSISASCSRNRSVILTICSFTARKTSSFWAARIWRSDVSLMVLLPSQGRKIRPREIPVGADRPRSPSTVAPAPDRRCPALPANKIQPVDDEAQLQAIESLGIGSADEAAIAVGRLLAVTEAAYERRAQPQHAPPSREAGEQGQRGPPGRERPPAGTP